MRENWDDLRYVVAVAETGSVSGAARLLGVNHATVLRRIAAFEDETGTEIFDKTPRGYIVLPDRLRIIAAAREVESAVQTVSRMVAGLKAPLSGRVRVTSTDTISCHVLPSVAARLKRDAPDLQIEFMSLNTHADLGRIQADIAVRPAEVLPDDLVGERCADFGFAAYALGGQRTEAWLGLTGVLARSVAGRWMEANVPASAIAASADSFLVLGAIAADGVGMVVLPCIVGDANPRLSRVAGVMPPMAVPLWVVSHADMADVPRIARVRTLLSGQLATEAERLSGVRV